MRLKELRKKNNITQKDLAQILQIDQSTISKWETGESMPRLETLISLTMILGVSLEELMRGEGSVIFDEKQAPNPNALEEGKEK